MRYAIDPTKIHNELGWLPETKFVGLKRPLNGILSIKNGGRISSMVSIRSIMKRCMGIAEEMYNENFGYRC